MFKNYFEKLFFEKLFLKMFPNESLVFGYLM